VSNLDQSAKLYIFQEENKINVSDALRESYVWDRLRAGRYDYRLVVRVAEWLADNACYTSVRKDAETAIHAWNEHGKGVVLEALKVQKEVYRKLGQYPGDQVLVDIWLRDDEMGIEPVSPSQREYYQREQIFRALSRKSGNELSTYVDDTLCSGPLAVVPVAKCALVYSSTDLDQAEMDEINSGDIVTCWMLTGAFDVIFFS